MQQHGSKYFAHRHSLDSGGGIKRSKHFFLKVVILHIKLKGMESKQNESKKYVLTHILNPWGGVKMSFFSFLKVVMLHIKLKGKRCRPTCKLKV